MLNEAINSISDMQDIDIKCWCEQYYHKRYTEQQDQEESRLYMLAYWCVINTLKISTSPKLSSPQVAPF
jgi:hypothetical protein